MATLGDIALKVWREYLAPSKKEASDKNVLSAFDPSDYGDAVRKWDADDMTPAKRRKLALSSPLFMKGTQKKNMDTFRAWFKLVPSGNKSIPAKVDVDIAENFEKRSNIRRFMYLIGTSIDIYGDGYLLINFSSDVKGDKYLAEKPPENATPYDVSLINPEHVKEYVYLSDKNKAEGIMHLHYVNTNTREDKYIHPSRFLHFKDTELPFSMFGISKIDILRKIIESQIDIDIASGEILKWFSHGITTITKEGLTKPERDKLLKVLKTHPSYFVFDERAKLDVVPASAINPRPFYDYITMCIAAVMVMPTHILTGIEVGRVTGAEIGYGDYYRDIHDRQELVFSSQLEKLYTMLFSSYGREFKYKIVWNTIYIDELAEADLMGKRVAAAANATSYGIISKEEARRMLRDGEIELDPALIPEPDDREPRGPPEPDDRKPVRPDSDRVQLPVKRQSGLRTELSDDEKELIKKYKEMLKAKAEAERKLGEEILKEQEKLDNK